MKPLCVDFVVFLVVLNQEQKPVLIAEMKDDRWANEPDKRQRADSQMRQRFDQMLPNCAIPRLYGLLGTFVAIIWLWAKLHLTLSTAPRWIGFCHSTSWRDCGI